MGKRRASSAALLSALTRMLLFGVVLTGASAYCAATLTAIDIKGMTIEQLMDIDVYTASRRAEPYQASPNAVYVLTSEEIHRARATTIPEALRLVPGVQVARIDANKWAVSIRGFNGRAANKLLVLIDGRTIYDPLFSGTFWESRDVMLEDIDRIEVIRGPGGTLWGANAVNGVINIVTKHARDTQGGLAVAGAGTEKRAFGAARYGWRSGDAHHARVYVMGHELDTGFLSGEDPFDQAEMARAGFRWDWDVNARDTVRVSGDTFRGDAGENNRALPPTPPSPDAVTEGEHSGANLLARWSRQLAPAETVRVQFIYDHFEFDHPGLGEIRDTVDLELQHGFAPAPRHSVVWGLGYRSTSDDIENGPIIALDPTSKRDETTSAFLQDTYELSPDTLHLTLGAKVERNDYTGAEWQPNVRLAWTPDARRTWWTSLSRAVRVPPRLESDFLFLGTRLGDNLESERVYAYELGYRRQYSPSLWYDVAGFYNQYRGMLTVHQDFQFRNQLDGRTYGVEVAGRWQPFARLRLDAAYTYLQMDLELDAEVLSPDPETVEGSDPRQQVALRSAYDMENGIELDAILRFVDELSGFDVPAYTALDLGVSWLPRRDLKLSLVAQNLLDDHHPEWNVRSGLGTEVQRGVYAVLRWGH
jgi:iron complex outermembrane recepter protein